jgi:Rhodopirellula transposase DDE domain
VVDAEPAARRFKAVASHLNERQRRLLLAAEAKELGRGGVTALARLTGAARSTIQAGLRELAHESVEVSGPPDRTRRPGGGRKKVTVIDPGLASAIEALVDPDARGDPESPLRWTLKSTRNLADELTARGHPTSSRTVAHVLEDDLGFSLQANRKTVEGKQHPDRDAQFRYINEQVRSYTRRREPVLSVDSKKKELVGSYKNQGKTWRRKKDPEKVQIHDFIDKEQGKAIPYGIWDMSRNRGWVSVGIDHDTAAFAVAALRSWWINEGRHVYPKARRVLICADAGGSNSSRSRLWKLELSRLATDIGLAITVCHFPPGTSKWNKIEHRLWSQVTSNWRGQPLTSRQVAVDLIGATTTRTGLTVHAELDEGSYPSGIKVADEEMASIRLERHDFHGDWNYTIRPPRSSRTTAA